MADISQVKLPNGDTYNLVDETSGFGKIHILEVLSNDSDNNYLPTGSYANLSTWINNGEFVIIKYNEVYFYYRGYYSTYGEYQFYSISGQSILIRGDNNITVNWDWYITSETDPVFSASAAAGITATDISNWNNKSDTDEKVALNQLSGGTVTYPILGNSTAAATRQYDAIGFSYQPTNSSSGTGQSRLFLGNNIASGNNNNRQGVIRLYGSTTYWTDLIPGTLTTNRAITLPDATGTIALTSDIPQVYSSTNTGGYLTMATLPIYDGTVE